MVARIGVDVDGAIAVSAGFEALEGLVRVGTTREVRTHAELLRSTVRAGASGRPGPRVQTGDYRRNIAVNHGTGMSPTGRLVPASTVRSNSPQAWRLEKGFVGADVLGRIYNQPPFPHWGPAVDVVEPRLQAALVRVVDEAEAATVGIGSFARSRTGLGSIYRRGV